MKASYKNRTITVPTSTDQATLSQILQVCKSVNYHLTQLFDGQYQQHVSQEWSNRVSQTAAARAEAHDDTVEALIRGHFFTVCTRDENNVPIITTASVLNNSKHVMELCELCNAIRIVSLDSIAPETLLIAVGNLLKVPMQPIVAKLASLGYELDMEYTYTAKPTTVVIKGFNNDFEGDYVESGEPDLPVIGDGFTLQLDKHTVYTPNGYTAQTSTGKDIDTECIVMPVTSPNFKKVLVSTTSEKVWTYETAANILAARGLSLDVDKSYKVVSLVPDSSVVYVDEDSTPDSVMADVNVKLDKVTLVGNMHSNTIEILEALRVSLQKEVYGLDGHNKPFKFQ